MPKKLCSADTPTDARNGSFAPGKAAGRRSLREGPAAIEYLQAPVRQVDMDENPPGRMFARMKEAENDTTTNRNHQTDSD